MIPSIVWTVIWALINFGIGFVLGILIRYVPILIKEILEYVLALLLAGFIVTVTLFYPLSIYFHIVHIVFSYIFSSILWSLEQIPPTFLTDIKTQPVNTISSIVGFVIGAILSIGMALADETFNDPDRFSPTINPDKFKLFDEKTGKVRSDDDYKIRLINERNDDD